MEDAFSKRMSFYEGRFKDEWAMLKNLPLYDFDQDAVFEDIERRGPIPRRVIRG